MQSRHLLNVVLGDLNPTTSFPAATILEWLTSTHIVHRCDAATPLPANMTNAIVRSRLECLNCGFLYSGNIVVESFDADSGRVPSSNETTPILPPQPCPHCEQSQFEAWTLPDALYDWLLTVTAGAGIEAVDRQRIGGVFTASACEKMLVDVIAFSLRRLALPQSLIRYLLDNAHGRKKLRELYQAVAAKSIGEILDEAQLRSWDRAWEALANARNKYAHGQDVPCDIADKIRIATNGIEAAYVVLRNAVLEDDEARVLKPPAP